MGPCSQYCRDGAMCQVVPSTEAVKKPVTLLMVSNCIGWRIWLTDTVVCGDVTWMTNHSPGHREVAAAWNCGSCLRVSLSGLGHCVRTQMSRRSTKQQQQLSIATAVCRCNKNKTYLKYVCLRAREPLHVEGGRSKDSRRSSQAFLLLT